METTTTTIIELVSQEPIIVMLNIENVKNRIENAKKNDDFFVDLPVSPLGLTYINIKHIVRLYQ